MLYLIRKISVPKLCAVKEHVDVLLTNSDEDAWPPTEKTFFTRFPFAKAHSIAAAVTCLALVLNNNVYLRCHFTIR